MGREAQGGPREGPWGPGKAQAPGEGPGRSREGPGKAQGEGAQAGGRAQGPVGPIIPSV